MPRHDSRKKWTWRTGDVPITTAKAPLALESRGKNPSPIEYSWETRVLYPGGKIRNSFHGMQRKKTNENSPHQRCNRNFGPPLPFPIYRAQLPRANIPEERRMVGWWMEGWIRCHITSAVQHRGLCAVLVSHSFPSSSARVPNLLYSTSSEAPTSGAMEEP